MSGVLLARPEKKVLSAFDLKLVKVQLHNTAWRNWENVLSWA